MALTRHGQKLWQVENIDADVLALDPKTGNLWCSGGSRLNQGETVVLDENGREVAAYPLRAIDMVYDPHADAFWTAGYEILKVSRDGEVLFRKPVEGWCCASVSADPRDGSVWLVERDHPDVAKSRNRLWKLKTDGSVAVNLDLGEQHLFAVACDPQSEQVWVATLSGGLRRFSLAGEPRGSTDLRVYNLALAGDGVWAVTDAAALKLDHDGNETTRYEFDRPSKQAWIATW